MRRWDGMDGRGRLIPIVLDATQSGPTAWRGATTRRCRLRPPGVSMRLLGWPARHRRRAQAAIRYPTARGGRRQHRGRRPARARRALAWMLLLRRPERPARGRDRHGLARTLSRLVHLALACVCMYPACEVCAAATLLLQSDACGLFARIFWNMTCMLHVVYTGVTENRE